MKFLSFLVNMRESQHSCSPSLETSVLPPSKARTLLHSVGDNVDGIPAHSTGTSEVNVSYKEESTQQTPGKKQLSKPSEQC